MTLPRDVVARALAYPFGIPHGSYALAGGEVDSLREEDLAPRGRAVLLAFGANASPLALAAKLGEAAREKRIAVLAAQLHDFDVVYSAHFSPYGAIPGALQHAPGAVAPVHALHLAPAQLARVHRTEPNYEFARLDGVDLRVEGGGRLTSVYAYVSRHGCLRRDGGHVGVAEIPVGGRAWPALGQAEILAAARDALAPGEELADFVLSNVADPQLAARRTAALRAQAAPLAWPARPAA